MLASRSSTPRPRQVDVGQSSFAEYNKDAAASDDMSWTSLTDTIESKERERSLIESPPTEARPRKRRRITSDDSVATQLDISTAHSYQHRPLSTTCRSTSTSHLLSSGPLADSRGICQTCRCKSNHFCSSRCGTSTCSVCSRTCTVTAMSTPPTPLLCFSATPSPRPNSSQLPLDDSFDTFEGVDTDDLRARLTLDTHFPATSKRQSSSLTTSPPPKFDSDTRNSSWLDGPSLGGCGRVVCQPCAVEDLDSHEFTCLDCLDCFGFPSLPAHQLFEL
ncbi:hypothetical protein CTheo_4742 [Ceratobasidium theobromae]|uniref:Uncharacterized protein n=1 Tax=Ceratobasidium theobromae TaxID=1582974 RepID=A0A5N5QK11_9AGAM|nr:hypothetical protein CTheo_4742 [Ceratobasidium theobromae]